MSDRSSHDPYAPEASNPTVGGAAKKTASRGRKRAAAKKTAAKKTAAAETSSTAAPAKEAMVPETTPATTKDGS